VMRLRRALHILLHTGDERQGLHSIEIFYRNMRPLSCISGGPVANYSQSKLALTLFHPARPGSSRP
jgi:hypothetical protein